MVYLFPKELLSYVVLGTGDGIQNKTNKAQTFIVLTFQLGEDSKETNKQRIIKQFLNTTKKIRPIDIKYSDEDIGPMFKVRTLVSRNKNDKYKAGSQKEAEIAGERLGQRQEYRQDLDVWPQMTETQEVRHKKTAYKNRVRSATWLLQFNHHRACVE